MFFNVSAFICTSKLLLYISSLYKLDIDSKPDKFMLSVSVPHLILCDRDTGADLPYLRKKETKIKRTQMYIAGCLWGSKAVLQDFFFFLMKFAVDTC